MRFVHAMVAAVFLLSSCVISQAEQANVIATARAVDDHYNQLKSLKCAFIQTYQGPGVSRKESGTVWLKKPGRTRWEYQEPKQKLFLTDAENAYFYVPGELQARKAPLNKVDDLRSPLRYLLGKTRLEKELDGLSLAPDITPLEAGNVVLRGFPQGLKDQVSEVAVEITPSHRIARIIIQGVDDTTTDFRFSHIEEDLDLPESLFHFQVPAGVTVITNTQVLD